MTGIGHNRLGGRAEAIRNLIAESDAAALTSIDKAIEAGHALAEAKAECGHGEWLPFLERAGVKERRARQYMQLASSDLKSATVADLGGIRGALEFLAKRDKAAALLAAMQVAKWEGILGDADCSLAAENRETRAVATIALYLDQVRFEALMPIFDELVWMFESSRAA